MSKTSTGPRRIVAFIAEVGILLAIGALAIVLVGNDGSGRAEESASGPELPTTAASAASAASDR